jgi:phosphate butyryltransferase
MIRNFDELLAHARTIKGKRVVVVAPSNAETFEAITAARDQLDIGLILVGDRDTISAGVRGGKPGEILHRPDVRQALEVAIELVRKGEAHVLLKGGVDTATMMKAVLHQESGLRTGRLLSDVFLFEDASRGETAFVMITDGGLALAPELKEKIALIANAVDVAHALGNQIGRAHV